ncbi:MAG: hypothetical protein DMF58_14540, partial [Acidobacteria bacterium]
MTKIQNLLALDYPGDRIEILVGSDGSTDSTAEKLLTISDNRVRVFNFPQRRGKPAVLNTLVPKAKGDIVVLADVRQRFESEVLRAFARSFADPQIGAVSGEVVLTTESGTAVSEGAGLYWRYETFIRSRECMIDSTIAVTGPIYAIRRTLFEPIPPDTIVDDLLIPLRISRRGYRVIVEPEARAIDSAYATASQEFTRKVRTLAGNFQLFARERWLLNPFQNRLWWDRPCRFERGAARRICLIRIHNGHADRLLCRCAGRMGPSARLEEAFHHHLSVLLLSDELDDSARLSSIDHRATAGYLAKGDGQQHIEMNMPREFLNGFVLAFSLLIGPGLWASCYGRSVAVTELPNPLDDDRPPGSPPELPRAEVQLPGAGTSGVVRVVANSDDFQSAIDDAKPGDVIALLPGSVYRGSLTLPKKEGDEWITIRTNVPDGTFPVRGTRVGPSDARMMPVIESDDESAIQAEAGAHHYRFIGIEIRPKAGVYIRNLVLLGVGANTVEDLPHHLIFERCYVHGDANVGGRRGIALNTRDAAVVDSYFSDF